MIETLHIENHGPMITASNYWQSEAAQAGKLYLSVNAGCFRLMVPDNQRGIISDMRLGAKHIVVSYLSGEWHDGQFAVEWLAEDGTASPWSCHLSPGQVDRKAGRDDTGKEWVAAVWVWKKGGPQKAFERKAYCQIVPEFGFPFKGFTV